MACQGPDAAPPQQGGVSLTLRPDYSGPRSKFSSILEPALSRSRQHCLSYSSIRSTQ